jgi:hypothetical protein
LSVVRRKEVVDALPSGLRYYRLRQVDLDGHESFSPVLAVQAAPPSSTLVAYPSPATDIKAERTHRFVKY